jgi:predicted nucleic acid-binding protein
LLGAVRQEILTGIRERTKFLKIRGELRDYEDVALTYEDYENAARMSNICRHSGIAATPIDMLICAASQKHDWQIFSTDRDFFHYAKILPHSDDAATSLRLAFGRESFAILNR